MGKKKKRIKAKSTKAHKDKIQARRQRQKQSQIRRESSDSMLEIQIEDESVEILIGDRVFCNDYDVLKDGASYRGLIKDIKFMEGKDSCETVYTYLPINCRDLEQNRIKVFRKDLIRDTYPLYPRFEIGDDVLIHQRDHWIPAVIRDIYPPDLYLPDEGMFPYRVTWVHTDCNGNPLYSFVPNDEDDCIIKRLNHFRFKVGDKVLISPVYCDSVGNDWIPGNIVDIDKDLGEYTCEYTCEYVSGKKSKRHKKLCKICNDNDDHITAINSPPRQRLLDAIQQNCEYEHFCTLIESTKLDVLTFKDLIIEHSIAAANYGSLLWLQEHANVNLSSISDSTCGGGFLHRIVKSPNSHLFFKAHCSNAEKEIRIDFNFFEENPSSSKEIPVLQKNTKGQIFLFALIESGNARCLEIILFNKQKTFKYLGKQFYSIEEIFKDNEGIDLMQYACSKEQWEICYLLHQYHETKTFLDLYNHLIYSAGFKHSESKAVIMNASRLVDYDVELMPSRFINFCDGDQRCFLVKSSINHGDPYLLKWLLRASEDLLNVKIHCSTNVDRFLYEQKEMYSIFRNTMESIEENTHYKHDLVSFAINRERVFIHYPGDKIDSFYYDLFLSRLRSKQTVEGQINFVCEIERFISQNNIKDHHEESSFFNAKKLFLTDHKYLNGRLEILEYLHKEKHLDLPHPLRIIQERQCGILRWLVGESYIKLEEPAYSCEMLLQKSDSIPVKFLHNFKIARLPKSINVATCLAFASIQYDDLHSLQWILDTCIGLQEKDFEIFGWNLYHVCAYYGRREIFLYLNQTIFKNTFKAVCKGKLYRNFFASHIAVSRGFTTLGDYLLDSGCPVNTNEGRSIYEISKKSNLSHVRSWGNSREQPDLLGLDIAKLFQILDQEPCSLKEIKVHLQKTKCMNANRWLECDYDNVDMQDSNGRFSGMTYRGILECLYMTGDEAFVIWLLETLGPPQEQDKNYFFASFWKQSCYKNSYPRIKVCSAIKILDEESISHFCQLDVLSHSTIEDPCDHNPMIKHALEFYDCNQNVSKRLELYQKSVLKHFVLLEVMKNIDGYMNNDIFKNNLLVDDIEKHSKIFQQAAQILRKEKLSIPEFYALQKDGKYNISSHCMTINETKHPIFNQIFFHAKAPIQIKKNHIIAFEGFQDLMTWTLAPSQNMWTSEGELESTRIAAFSGHSQIVSIFLKDIQTDTCFKSSLQSRIFAAALGATESGKVKDLMNYLKRLDLSQINLSVDEESFEYVEDLDSMLDLRFQAIGSTLIGSTLGGYILSTENCDDRYLKTIFLLLKEGFSDLKSVFTSLHRLAKSCTIHTPTSYQKVLRIIRSIISGQKYNISITQKCICELIVEILNRIRWFEGSADFLSVLNQYFHLVVDTGIDIQDIFIDDPHHFGRKNNEIKKAAEELENAKKNQREMWKRFDMIEKGDSLSIIKSEISKDMEFTWRNQEGLPLIHLVAAYDRDDVLAWLVTAKNISLSQLDGKGRTVYEVAQASCATKVLKWFSLHQAKLILSIFISSQYKRRRDQRKYDLFLHSLRSLQAKFRGRKVRQFYMDILIRRVQQAHQFLTTWSSATTVVGNKSDISWLSWKLIKIEEDDQMSKEEIQPELYLPSLDLTNDLKLSLDVNDEEDDDKQNTLEQGKLYIKNEIISADYQECDNLKRILLTKDVLKWLRKCDTKYREFFQRRIIQLADGFRSHTIAKGLTGCKTRIFETYLEQKSGFRILWTFMPPNKDIRIWYVSKHDDVCRHIMLIENAEKRSKRQLVAASEVDSFYDAKTSNSSNTIMLDPTGNVPMKVYEVTYENMHRLNDQAWCPPLYLNEKERDIVNTNGTVLVLGRSGTGKTVCISNRMDYDWRRFQCDHTFSQLFISRSKKLCNYVKGNVESFAGGHFDSRRFMTFSELIIYIENKLPLHDGVTYSFVPSQKMTFSKFKRNFYSSDKCSLPALTVWRSIHVFIKGSMEPLSELEYINLGAKRNILALEQRKSVYGVYERYKKYMSDGKHWDDGDRIRSIIDRLKLATREDPYFISSVRVSKIYVDEIQDYTQIEISLFFMLSGPESLFLAGDPAQSVVDGADFQFKDVRCVGYHLFGQDRRDLIPTKPKTLNLNFRSHSGILHVASAVLQCMSKAFPGSIDQTNLDNALFKGPRPGLLYRVKVESLYELLKKVEGIVFLTHDDNVARLRKSLHLYPLVLGIKEAKGLEFQSVVVVDYFEGISSNEYQKAWRDLLLGRQFEYKQFPEIESQLKLLYTGVTRSIQRLFFAETVGSIAGEAFIRWSTTTTVTICNRMQALAVQQNVNDVEAMSRTKDEWRSAGLDNAIMAEQEEMELIQKQSWLDRAIYCFSKSGDAALARIARTHRKSVRLQSSLPEKKSLDEMSRSELYTLELKAVEVLEQVFREKLILEARQFILAISPILLRLYERDQIQSYLLDKLPCEKEIVTLL